MQPKKRGALNNQGHELPDPTPMSIPAGFRRPDTLAEQVQRLVRGALSRQAAEQGAETFEESEDFDTGEDQDPHSPFETYFDPILGRDMSLDEFRRNEAVYRQQFLDREHQRADQEERTLAQQDTLKKARAARKAGARKPDKPASDTTKSDSRTSPDAK